MLISIIQSLTSLILSGFFLYVIFNTKRFEGQRRLQETLIGVVFGVLVISLGLNAYILEPRGVPVDASAGPLIFAGYIAGPIGVLIAGTCAVFIGFMTSEPMPMAGVFMCFAVPTVGLIVRSLRPVSNWPSVPRAAIGFLLFGYVLLFSVPIIFAVTNMPAQGGYSAVAYTVGTLVSVGVVSIFFMWKIMRWVVEFAVMPKRAHALGERLGLTLRHSKMGCFEIIIDGLEVHYDADTIEIFGVELEPGLIPTEVWQGLIHPDDLEATLTEIQTATLNSIPREHFDFRVIRPDGECRHIRAYWVAQRDANGIATHINGLFSDLTDIREAEKTHMETMDRLSLIAKRLPGAMLQADVTDWDNPELLYISPNCELIWGYTDAEIMADNQLLYRAHDPAHVTNFQNILLSGIASHSTIVHRYSIVARDGTKRWVDYHGGSTVVNGRTLLEAIILDVTNEVEAQQQVEAERDIAHRAQKSESIGLLTGGVAHDFNNLLAVVMGNLELLKDEAKSAREIEQIDAAIAASLRGADLTKSMLAFAREARLSPVVLDLNAIARDAKNWMARALPSSISVETALSDGVWPIEADRSALESALLNLILNGRDAMGGHGKLTIETTNVRMDEPDFDTRQEELKPGRYVVLAVSDTGSGIPEEVLASMFDPFFTTKPPGSGSGLGLSMAIGFMRQSGGTIQVDTEMGMGTTFKLYFPAVEASIETAPLKSKTTKQVADGCNKVLLAEDEVAVGKVLVTIMEREGYDVTLSCSGDEALSVFQADPTFDLLVTDIVMPGTLQGTDLATEIRKEWPDLPVVFMSGYASEARVHGNGLRPEDIRLMKPVQRVDLLRAMAEALEPEKT